MVDAALFGIVQQIGVSGGGVPKRPVPAAEIGPEGLQGDAQADVRHHGGPERAVCLYSAERIGALRAEGHPIEAGALGENLTLAGLPWEQVVPGSVLTFDGGVCLQVASYAVPCATISGAFRDRGVQRVAQERHAGWSRVYARVLRTGHLKTGARVTLTNPPDPGG